MLDLYSLLNDACVEASNSVKSKGFNDDDLFMLDIFLALPGPKAERFHEIWTNNRKLAKIALIHSELSEAVEGTRKGSMDDKLPLRSQEEVELADTFIRLMDYSGFYGLDLGGAIQEKQEYNKTREYKHGKKV